MSMPPQGPNGPQNPDPYGASPQGQWNQPQGWNPNQQPDPYQQQQDAYGQQQPYGQDPYPQAPYGQDPYSTQQMPPAYDASLSTASMSAQPQGQPDPNWNQLPPKSKLPWIVAAAIVVVGAIVATVIIVTGKDSTKNTATNDPAQQTQTDAGGQTSEGSPKSEDPKSNDPKPTSPKTTEKGGSGGSSSSLPADIPVPASVTIDDKATFCSGSSCIGTFTADDPQAAYNDWLDGLEGAGYSIDSKQSTGSGSNTYWMIEASGPLKLSLYWATGTGALLSE